MDLSKELTKIVNDIVKKLQKDPNLLKNFKKEPVKTLEGLTGIDLPDESVTAVVAAVKAKLVSTDLTKAANLATAFLKK